MRCFLLAAFLFFVAHAPSSAQPVRTEQVVYASGDLALAATLLLPEGQGPFPGAVLVHGSGSSDRSNPWTSAYADALVERGIAVIHPDKRGSGMSEGAWQEATFEDLARDATAALAFLATHPAVDTARVGFVGFSQGGHVVPLAAQYASQADFVVNVSGSVVPMMEQIGDEMRLRGERAGLPPGALQTVLAIHDHAVHYLSTGDGWDVYAAALAEAKQHPSGAADILSGFPTDPASPTWGFLRLIADYDPLPYWQEVSVPALFLYGGRDENVDVFKSADLIEEVLTPAGLDYTLLLFRTNGHALFREDAMDFMARWMHRGGAH